MKRITRQAAKPIVTFTCNLTGVKAVSAMQRLVVSSGNVVPFERRPAIGARLSMRDRMEVTTWAESARARGYDRLVIHERTSSDPEDVDSFLSIYRRGECWSRWNVARRGASVLAWCSVSGADLGQFASVSDALGSLLDGQAPPRRVGGEVIAAFA